MEVTDWRLFEDFDIGGYSPYEQIMRGERCSVWRHGKVLILLEGERGGTVWAIARTEDWSDSTVLSSYSDLERLDEMVRGLERAQRELEDQEEDE